MLDEFRAPRHPQMEPCWAQVGAILRPSGTNVAMMNGLELCWRSPTAQEPKISSSDAGQRLHFGAISAPKSDQVRVLKPF